jgi:hypothetical protein
MDNRKKAVSLDIMEMEGRMTEAALLHWLYRLLKPVCTTHVAFRVTCAAILFFGWSIWDADQNAKDRIAFERELTLRHLDELHRQAEHQRQMELLEAMKHRRDLTQPAEPDEGY